MGRGPKWNNQEMWEWCTAQSRGGVSYSEIQGQLARAENKRRFGLIEIPSTDTIRRNVSELLGRRQRSASSLPENQLRDHHGALAFLAISIRSYIDDVKGLNHGILTNGTIAESWCGFSLAKRLPREPNSLVEEEVAESWESHDPRTHPRYQQLERHLEQTRSGRKVLYALGQVYEAGSEFIRAQTGLVDRIRESISELVAPTEAELNRLVYAIVNVMEKYQPDSTEEMLLGRIFRVSSEAKDVANSLFPSWIKSSEFAASAESVKRLGNVQRLLRKHLGDSVFIRRLIQEGECEVCSMDALETEGVDTNDE